jgi:hypothetical protein
VNLFISLSPIYVKGIFQSKDSVLLLVLFGGVFEGTGRCNHFFLLSRNENIFQNVYFVLTVNFLIAHLLTSF